MYHAFVVAIFGYKKLGNIVCPHYFEGMNNKTFGFDGFARIISRA